MDRIRTVVAAIRAAEDRLLSERAALEDRHARAATYVRVSDIAMPGDDGYALIRKVRALPPERGGRIPAVAVTAHARGEERARALLAGFQLHVPKPVEPAELVAVVVSLLRRGGSAQGWCAGRLRGAARTVAGGLDGLVDRRRGGVSRRCRAARATLTRGWPGT
jgi:CheY-like chemotaxis protein